MAEEAVLKCRFHCTCISGNMFMFQVDRMHLCVFRNCNQVSEVRTMTCKLMYDKFEKYKFMYR